MPYHEPLSSIVTTTKRNHRNYGPTESNKMDGSVTEIAVDLNTIYMEITDLQRSIDALASGYLTPSGSINSLWDLKREASHLEERMYNRIYLQSNKA